MERSLPREAYWDEAFFARERRAIFWDQWLYAGRAERIAETGAYLVVDIAGESVVIVRAEEGLFAHLNFCRHRGSRLLCGEGVVRGAIRCPYHSWAYALDGRLLASPFVPRDEVPLDARRLHRVAVAQWGGFLFVHLAPERAGELLDQLGEIPARLARYPLRELRAASSLHYEVDANWKVM